jgi:hypothetical protein
MRPEPAATAEWHSLNVVIKSRIMQRMGHGAHTYNTLVVKHHLEDMRGYY